VPELVVSHAKAQAVLYKLHLVQFREVELKFIPSISGILQQTLELFCPVVILNPLFKLSSFPLVTVGLGLQIVQGTVRKLQFTFLERVNIRNRCVQEVRCTCSLHRSWSTFSCSRKRPARAELSTRSPSWRLRLTSRVEVFFTSSRNSFSNSSAPG